jgi:hypothetical protein
MSLLGTPVLWSEREIQGFQNGAANAPTVTPITFTKQTISAFLIFSNSEHHLPSNLKLATATPVKKINKLLSEYNVLNPF